MLAETWEYTFVMIGMSFVGLLLLIRAMINRKRKSMVAETEEAEVRGCDPRY